MKFSKYETEKYYRREDTPVTQRNIFKVHFDFQIIFSTLIIFQTMNTYILKIKDLNPYALQFKNQQGPQDAKRWSQKKV